jgi:hypothetical protein
MEHVSYMWTISIANRAHARTLVVLIYI